MGLSASRIVLGLVLAVIAYLLSGLIFNDAWSTIIALIVFLVAVFGDELRRI